MAQRVLHITEHDQLTLPAAEAATQTLVVYGGKGMGKTNLVGVLLEELAAAGQRWSLIDPVGVSWGIQYAADGKGPGVECVILGGVHGDIPIDPTGGLVVADFVVDEHANVVIDISRKPDGRMWSIGERIRFVRDYARRLYERQGEKRRPLLQLIDEAGRFAPQNPPKGATDIMECLGAIQVLVEEGRNVGVGVCLVTQRSARMDKTVSELAECMIAFRTVGPRSVDAIVDWFGEHVEKARWKELVEQLRQLPLGTALVVSPGWLGFEGTAPIRKRRTFDSSATPTAAARKLPSKAAARPDLEKLKARLAETSRLAIDSDPRVLRQNRDELDKALHRALATVRTQTEQIQELKARPAKGGTSAETKKDIFKLRRALGEAMKILVKVQAVKFEPGDVKELEGAIGKAVMQIVTAVEQRLTNAIAKVEGVRKTAAAAERTIKQLLEQDVDVEVVVEKREPSIVMPTQRAAARAAAPRPTPSGPAGEDPRLVSAHGALKKHVTGILTALAQHGRRTRAQTLILAGYQPSGDISTAFAAMLEHGWIQENGGGLEITPAGTQALGPFDPLPSGAALREQLLRDDGKLSSAARKILGAAFLAYENSEHPVSRARLHELAGLKPSGDTSTAIARFVRLGWLEQSGREFIAARTFYEEA